MEVTAGDIETLDLTIDYQRAPEHFQPLINSAKIRTLPFTDPKSSSRIPGLVATDGHIAWSQLSALGKWLEDNCSDNHDTAIPTFCEWGSGLGVNACIASRLGWNAIGIELEPSLVSAANQLSQDYGLTTRFFEASYKPDGFDVAKLTNSALRTKHGFGLFDFDIIYGFYWPAEYKAMKTFFSRNGKTGSLFFMYSGGTTFELLRKI